MSTFVAMFRKFKALFFICIAMSVLNGTIPFHSIIHDHHFVVLDSCEENHCNKHYKSYTQPCCEISDAVFIADLPKGIDFIHIENNFILINSPYHIGNDFKLHFFVNNKAPPVALT